MSENAIRVCTSCRRLDGHYRYLEIGPFYHTYLGIEHRPPIPPPGEMRAKDAYTILTEPQALYGFIRKALTTKQGQLQGLRGDELTVFHIKDAGSPRDAQNIFLCDQERARQCGGILDCHPSGRQQIRHVQELQAAGSPNCTLIISASPFVSHCGDPPSMLR